MSDFTFRPQALEEAIAYALREAGLFVVDEVVKITPRDLERLPQSISRKDGKPPKRSSASKPVLIDGEWYPGVTGNLKRSIKSEVVSDREVRIGVEKGPASKYAPYLEFGTRTMAPRSFLRKTLEDKKSQIMKVISDSFRQKL